MLLEDLNLDAETVAPLFPETEVIAFNYAALPPVDAAKVRKAADVIRGNMDNAKQSIFEIGRELASVKDAIPHGQFGKWISTEFEADFGMTERTAQNYMNAFRLFTESETVSVLPPKALYALASSRTPVEIKNRVFDQIKNGTVPSADVIARDITEAKAEAKKAAAMAKLKTDAERKAADKKEKASAAYKAKKEKQEAKEQAERERQRTEALQAAEKAVTMLQDKLGSEFSAFCELYKLSSWLFNECLNLAASAKMAEADRMAA